MKHLIEVGKSYTRKEVKARLGLPNPDKLNMYWQSGYVQIGNTVIIFANVNVPGKTGHDYPNQWVDGKLYWYTKTNHSLTTEVINKMIKGELEVLIFTRDNNNNPFTFHGYGYSLDFEDGKPATIVWRVINDLTLLPNDYKPKNRYKFVEGTQKQGFVTRYERNPQARQACLDHYGYICQVCMFDFYQKYGLIGKDFIHVHHRLEISNIKKEYVINPITDLIPVCANCHAMLHKRKPAYTVDELKEIIAEQDAS